MFALLSKASQYLILNRLLGKVCHFHEFATGCSSIVENAVGSRGLHIAFQFDVGTNNFVSKNGTKS